MKLFTSEQVSWGHPDKICDRISDALLTQCLRYDKESRCAIETMIKGYDIYVVGEVTSRYDIESYIPSIVKSVLNDTRLDAGMYKIHENISKQSADIALGTDSDVGGAGDQGMMFGYATNETKELLPIPYVLATRALQILRERELRGIDGYRMLGSDAKSQVTFDYDNNRIDTFLISSQHRKDMSLEDVRTLIQGVMIEVAVSYGYNTDFKMLVNPTGRFVLGSSFADSGLTGRKIIADTYGGAAHHGGGAFSGKDPTKVDRSASYAARKIACDIVSNKMADRCEIQLAYAIGVPEPVSIDVDCFGTEKEDIEVLKDYIQKSYNLTPKGIIEDLKLKDIDYYSLTSCYGHFGKEYLPWEM